MYNVDQKVDSKTRNARLNQTNSARLGTARRPVTVRVQSEERKQEIISECEENGWVYEVEVDAEQPEELADLEQLRSPVQAVRVEKSAKRNDPCPCGSGKKYKHCHGRK